MGGNLFKLGRLPRADYLTIEAELVAYLDGRFPERYRIPRYYGSKPDFGDVDVLLSREVMTDGWEALKERIVGDLGIERFTYTGAALSTVYRDFQVDFFLVAPDELEASYCFMSFNDLGNLLGRIYRGFNLKYGMDGLSWVFRRESGSYKRDLLVSRDWERILSFLQLDHAAWLRGFGPVDAMFEWLLNSPYFRSKPYLDPEAPLRKRASQRPTIRAFIAYLEHRGIDRDYAFDEGREAYVSRIDAHFGTDLGSAIVHEKEEAARDACVAAKLNGRIAMDVTGLQGKELGMLMKRIRDHATRDELVAMSDEEVRALMRRLI